MALFDREKQKQKTGTFEKPRALLKLRYAPKQQPYLKTPGD